MKKYEVLHIVFDGWKKDYVNLGTFVSMSEAYAFAHDMKKTMRNETFEEILRSIRLPLGTLLFDETLFRTACV